MKLLTIGVLAGLPLIFSYSFYEPYTTVKVFLFRLFLCIAVPCAIYLLLYKRQFINIGQPLIIAIIFYGSAITLSLFTSFDILISINKIFETLCFILLYVTWLGTLDRKDTITYIKAIVISGFFIALYAIIQHCGLDFPGCGLSVHSEVKMRSVSTLGNPSYLAGYCAIVAPLSLGLFLSENYLWKDNVKNTILLFINRMVFPFIWFTSVIALLLTYTRGTWLAFAISHLVFFAFSVKYLIRNHKTYLIIIALLLIFSLTSVLIYDRLKDKRYEWYTFSNRLATIGNMNELHGSRLFLWKAAFEIIKAHPLLGTGPGTFPYAYLKYRFIEPSERRGANEFMGSCHNHYLETASSSGIIGLAAFCIVVFTALYYLIIILTKRGVNGCALWSAIMASFTAYIVHIFFLFPSISYEIIWWFLLAIISLEYHKDNELSRETLQYLGNKKKKQKDLRVFSTFKMMIITGLVLFSMSALTLAYSAAESDYYLNKAFISESRGEIRDALECFDKAIQKSPWNCSRYLYKAKFLEESFNNEPQTRQKINEISDLYQKASRLNRLDPYIKINAGRFYQSIAERGDINYIIEAEKSYKKAIELDPYNYLAYNYIATLYALQGDKEKALQSFNTSISLYEKTPLVHYNIAVFYLNQKNIAQARRHAERALELNPNYKNAVELLLIINNNSEI